MTGITSFGGYVPWQYLDRKLIFSAMGWFMTLGWESFGGGGIFLIAAAYGTIFALAGRTLWFQQGLRVPGGLLFTLAVWMTPLAVYGLERLAGVWPQDAPGAFREYHVWVKGSWVLMEVATILAGLLALRFVRFPFLTFPIAFTLWYMSMDLTPLLFGRPEFTWDQRLWVSLVFGLIVLVAAYAVDRRTEEDYAFWGYLFGLLAFWGGLSLMKSGGQLGRFGYCLINVALIVVSVLLQRRVFMVFGALGVFTYLSYLSWDLFRDSLVFPFVLTGIGIAVIYLAIVYQRNQPRIERALLGWLPDAVRRALPMQRV